MPTGGYAAALGDPAVVASIRAGVGDLASFDARNAGGGSAYFKTLAAREVVHWRRFHPPYSLLDMYQAAQGKKNLWALMNLPPREAIERAQATADAAHAQLLASLRRYVERKFDAQVRDGLLAGAALAATVGAFAAAAGASGPFVVAIAAIGLIVGVILGMIDWAGNAIRDGWRRLIEGMTPLERYFTLAGFRGTSSQVRSDEHKPELPPWQICGDSPSAKEAIVRDAFFMVAASDCIPDVGLEDDRHGIALWLACAFANATGSNYSAECWRRFGIYRAGSPPIARGEPEGGGTPYAPDASVGASAWVKPYLLKFAGQSASQLVALAADPPGEQAARVLRLYRQGGAAKTSLELLAGRNFETEDQVRGYAASLPVSKVPPMHDLGECPMSRAFLARYDAELRELEAAA